jgi:hypothetical protein
VSMNSGPLENMTYLPRFRAIALERVCPSQLSYTVYPSQLSYTDMSVQMISFYDNEVIFRYGEVVTLSIVMIGGDLSSSPGSSQWPYTVRRCCLSYGAG